MAKWFNIGGPCNPAKHYMLSATERLPEVVSLIDKEQYFVVHAPRQSGKAPGTFPASIERHGYRMIFAKGK